MFRRKVETLASVLGLGIVLIGIANQSIVHQTTVSENANASETWTLYDPDPNHIWNRVYRTLYRRESRDGHEYGYDELDPLLWAQTKYLLTDPANRQAVAVLDEFLSTHGEKAINDPLKRALLQRDLWAIFDWTTECFECIKQSANTSAAKLNLQTRLAQVIKRLALSPDQIATLPNTYKQSVDTRAFATSYDLNKRDQSFLPPDLFDPKGPWVALSIRGGDLVARGHVGAFSGRSVFSIFMSLPGGRAATLEYLKALGSFRNPWLVDPQTQRPTPNPDLPEFPAGTQLALVRRMVMIDVNGELRPTNIIEDVQIRVHRTIPRLIPNVLNLDRNEARGALDVYEFKLSRAKLFAGEAGGLHSLTKTDTEFPLFRSHDIDLFEQNLGNFPLNRMLRVSLQACASCHFQPGVHSILSRGRPERELLPAWDSNYDANGIKWWKGRQFSWGLLQGLWNSLN
ncbi:MAG TPA: hypothetical protein VHS05_17255 [Pyrinomonadaceae bacterium]|nr:hypothetical protein [Pyrinomonadaceae bacterium]